MIYCVEDDNSICDLIVYTLNKSGFEAEGFESGEAFAEAVAREVPELIILDIMLPGEDGFTILRKLRERPDTRDVPVIMATAKSSEIDRVRGLDMGADDYLVKPFGMLEMVARVRAMLRRNRTVSEANGADPGAGGRSDEKKINVGGIVIYPGAHKVSSNGKNVILTVKEYEILKLLAERPGMVFSREQILSNVWGIDYFGETRTVDVHVGALRGKLGECGSYIETVRGVGYRFEVPEADEVKK